MASARSRAGFGDSGSAGGSFSTGLKLTDLNDFVTPSQTCVLPMQGAAQPQPPPRQAQQRGSPSDAEAKQGAGAGGEARAASAPSLAAAPPGSVAAPIHNGGGDDGGGQVARVTLSDCLSCSGCLTSAESVLLDQQSLDALLERCAQPTRYAVVVSLSPQAVSSLATYWGVHHTPRVAQRRLVALFRALGARHVIDTGVGRCLSVLETCREAEHRARSAVARSGGAGGGAAIEPLFASACPGWTCYVEKAQPAAVPYLSRAKSPQAATGALVKRALGESGGGGGGGDGAAAPAVWHCAVMPCFDKKLESMRPDLEHETDCVLATTEVLELVKRFPHYADEATSAAAACRASAENGAASCAALDSALSLDATSFGGASGGYAAEVFRHVCRAVFGVHVPDERLRAFTPLRNADLRHLRLYRDAASGAYTLDRDNGDDDGGCDRRYQVAYSVAVAYGFRNIQNVIRRLKQHKLQWHFVEVMACPSGCSNGGGQLSAATAAAANADGGDGVEAESVTLYDDAAARKQQLRRVEAAYAEMATVHADECVKALKWWHWLGGDVASSSSSSSSCFRSARAQHGGDHDECDCGDGVEAKRTGDTSDDGDGDGGNGGEAVTMRRRSTALRCEFTALTSSRDAVRGTTTDW